MNTVDLETTKGLLDALKTYEVAWKAAYEAGEKSEKIEDLDARHRMGFEILRTLIAEADNPAAVAIVRLELLEFGQSLGKGLAILAAERYNM